MTKPNGLEYHLLGNWTPCTKIKYSEPGARIALDKIRRQRKKHKNMRRRKEASYYWCAECMAYHLTSIK